MAATRVRCTSSTNRNLSRRGRIAHNPRPTKRYFVDLSDTLNSRPQFSDQTPMGQNLDTGAIRIDNTGATPVTISNFKIAFGGVNRCHLESINDWTRADRHFSPKPVHTWWLTISTLLGNLVERCQANR
jgi:hypothetical protein